MADLCTPAPTIADALETYLSSPMFGVLGPNAAIILRLTWLAGAAAMLEQMLGRDNSAATLRRLQADIQAMLDDSETDTEVLQ